MKKAAILSAIVLTLSACQAVNDTLASVNGVLGAANSALSGSGSTSGAGNAGVGLVTSTVRASVQSALSQAQPDNNVRALFNEAKPAIENVIGRIACGANKNSLTVYTDPDHSTATFSSPLWYMNHHKSGCLNVLRIHNVKKKAANAVFFVVDYQSPQSEETARREYTAIKQPGGEWLFQWHL